MNECMAGLTPPKRLRISELNPHLLCALCGGYLIDATTIIECLHSFCKTCILRYLETSNYCPICEVLIHKTRPWQNIRLDHSLQNAVYKMVPGLFQNEMKRRREFYDIQNTHDKCGRTSSQPQGEIGDRIIFSQDEEFSISIEFSSDGKPVKEGKTKTLKRPKCPHDKRYLKCPAGLRVEHLKKFIRSKYSLPQTIDIDLFYELEPLSDTYSLMDVAYIYLWKRDCVLQLFYSFYEIPQRKRKLQSVSNVTEKVTKICKVMQDRTEKGGENRRSKKERSKDKKQDRVSGKRKVRAKTDTPTSSVCASMTGHVTVAPETGHVAASEVGITVPNLKRKHLATSSTADRSWSVSKHSSPSSVTSPSARRVSHWIGNNFMSSESNLQGSSSVHQTSPKQKSQPDSATSTVIASPCLKLSNKSSGGQAQSKASIKLFIKSSDITDCKHQTDETTPELTKTNFQNSLKVSRVKDKTYQNVTNVSELQFKNTQNNEKVPDLKDKNHQIKEYASKMRGKKLKTDLSFLYLKETECYKSKLLSEVKDKIIKNELLSSMKNRKIKNGVTVLEGNVKNSHNEHLSAAIDNKLNKCGSHCQVKNTNFRNGDIFSRVKDEAIEDKEKLTETMDTLKSSERVSVDKKPQNKSRVSNSVSKKFHKDPQNKSRVSNSVGKKFHKDHNVKKLQNNNQMSEVNVKKCYSCETVSNVKGNIFKHSGVLPETKERKLPKFENISEVKDKIVPNSDISELKDKNLSQTILDVKSNKSHKSESPSTMTDTVIQNGEIYSNIKDKKFGRGEIRLISKTNLFEKINYLTKSSHIKEEETELASMADSSFSQFKNIPKGDMKFINGVKKPDVKVNVSNQFPGTFDNLNLAHKSLNSDSEVCTSCVIYHTSQCHTTPDTYETSSPRSNSFPANNNNMCMMKPCPTASCQQTIGFNEEVFGVNIEDLSVVNVTTKSTGFNTNKDSTGVNTIKDSTATKDFTVVNATKNPTVNATKDSMVVSTTSDSTVENIIKDSTVDNTTKDSSAVNTTKDSTVNTTKDSKDIITNDSTDSTVTTTKDYHFVNTVKNFPGNNTTMNLPVANKTLNSPNFNTSKDLSDINAKNELPINTAKGFLAVNTSKDSPNLKTIKEFTVANAIKVSLTGNINNDSSAATKDSPVITTVMKDSPLFNIDNDSAVINAVKDITAVNQSFSCNSMVAQDTRPPREAQKLLDNQQMTNTAKEVVTDTQQNETDQGIQSNRVESTVLHTASETKTGVKQNVHSTQQNIVDSTQVILRGTTLASDTGKTLVSNTSYTNNVCTSQKTQNCMTKAIGTFIQEVSAVTDCENTEIENSPNDKAAKKAVAYSQVCSSIEQCSIKTTKSTVNVKSQKLRHLPDIPKQPLQSVCRYESPISESTPLVSNTTHKATSTKTETRNKCVHSKQATQLSNNPSLVSRVITIVPSSLSSTPHQLLATPVTATVFTGCLPESYIFSSSSSAPIVSPSKAASPSISVTSVHPVSIPETTPPMLISLLSHTRINPPMTFPGRGASPVSQTTTTSVTRALPRKPKVSIVVSSSSTLKANDLPVFPVREKDWTLNTAQPVSSKLPNSATLSVDTLFHSCPSTCLQTEAHALSPNNITSSVDSSISSVSTASICVLNTFLNMPTTETLPLKQPEPKSHIESIEASATRFSLSKESIKLDNFLYDLKSSEKEEPSFCNRSQNQESAPFVREAGVVLKMKQNSITNVCGSTSDQSPKKLEPHITAMHHLPKTVPHTSRSHSIAKFASMSSFSNTKYCNSIIQTTKISTLIPKSSSISSKAGALSKSFSYPSTVRSVPLSRSLMHPSVSPRFPRLNVSAVINGNSGYEREMLTKTLSATSSSLQTSSSTASISRHKLSSSSSKHSSKVVESRSEKHAKRKTIPPLSIPKSCLVGTTTLKLQRSPGSADHYIFAPLPDRCDSTTHPNGEQPKSKDGKYNRSRNPTPFPRQSKETVFLGNRQRVPTIKISDINRNPIIVESRGGEYSNSGSSHHSQYKSYSHGRSKSSSVSHNGSTQSRDRKSSDSNSSTGPGSITSVGECRQPTDSELLLSRHWHRYSTADLLFSGFKLASHNFHDLHYDTDAMPLDYSQSSSKS